MQRNTQNIEMTASNTILSGYPEAAAFIASDPDNSTTIYSPFRRLMARNLLYLESDLRDMEAEQSRLDEEDLQSNDMTAKMYARSWKKLKETASLPGQERAQKRLKLATDIRCILKEYYESLMLGKNILNLRGPDSQTFTAVRNWFDDADQTMEDRVPKLAGLSQDRLAGGADVIALNDPVEQDRLTMLIQHHLGLAFLASILFLERRGGELTLIRDVKIGTPQGSKAYISDQRISQVVALISILLAAAFLIGAIVGLYNVTDPTSRLWMIGVLTIAFAASLGLLTNARRAEVFGATAAYAAVLVVFVSGNLGSTSLDSTGLIKVICVNQ